MPIQVGFLALCVSRAERVCVVQVNRTSRRSTRQGGAMAILRVLAIQIVRRCVRAH